MTSPEIRLVHVDWKAKDTPGRVEVSRFPLTLRPAGDRLWTAESGVYPAVEGRTGQLAVGAPADGPAPELYLEGDEWEPLSAIADDEGRTWWIQKRNWDSGKRYHKSPLTNTAGTARFRVGGETVSVEVSPSEVTRPEFEAMVNEFRNGLWDLVRRQSGATATRAGLADGEDPDFARLVGALATSVNAALRSPHVELREAETEARPERARPSARTFQALARKGAPRKVPSRGHRPSYDTAENRALVTMVAIIERVVRGSSRAERARQDSYERRAAEAAERLAHLRSHKGTVWVTGARLRRDVEALAQSVERWSAAMERACSAAGTSGEEAKERRATIAVDKMKGALQYGPYANGDGYVEVSGFVRGLKRERNVGLRLRFGITLEEAVELFPAGKEMQFSGTAEQIGGWSKRGNTDWGTFWVQSMRPWPHKKAPFLKTLRAALHGVESEGADGFWRTLSASERRDQALEEDSYRTTVERYESIAGACDARARLLESLARSLQDAEARFAQEGVRPVAGAERRAAGSMVFVQNADYRSALIAYRGALDAAGLDVKDVDRLQTLEQIGLLDLPTLYERWVLVVMLRTLNEEFGFEASDGSGVLDALTSVQGDSAVSVELHSAAWERTMELTYQAVVAGTKRPDYVLTLRRNEGEADTESAVPERKLVMDAKFKPFHPLYGPSPASARFRMGVELSFLLAKGYGEEGANRVFVIHPGPGDASQEEREKYSALGGEPVEGDQYARQAWDLERDMLRGDRLNHDVGAVLLRPEERSALARLLRMHLFEGLVDTKGTYLREDGTLTPPMPSPPCPACCSANVTLRIHSKWIDYRCEESDCGHQWTATYCWNCGRHLWKLGPRLNYHMTRPMDPFDVKCPNCAEYLPVDLEVAE